MTQHSVQTITTNDELSLADILANIDSPPNKFLIYGGAGSGKSVNAFSIIIPYIASGYKVLYIITESNGLNGLYEGMRIYFNDVKPYLKPGQLFVANLINDINKQNESTVGSVASPDKTATSKGGMYCFFQFATDSCLCYDILDNRRKIVKFQDTKNLTSLPQASKSLIILDGYTTVDLDASGFTRWTQGGTVGKDNAMTRAGLAGSGTKTAKQLISAIPVDLIVIAHERVASLNPTTLLGNDAPKTAEIKERHEVVDSLNENSTGMPDIGTNTSRSGFLGSFSVVLHAEDTKKTDNVKIPRFIYTDYTDSTWYGRVPASLEVLINAYKKQQNLPNYVLPQNGLNPILLGFLQEKGRLSDYEELISRFKLKSLI